MENVLVAVCEPSSSVVAAPIEFTNWKQPGAPMPPSGMPGLNWPKLSKWPLMTAAPGMLLVVQVTVEPSTGAGAQASASAAASRELVEKPPASVALMSRLPGSTTLGPVVPGVQPAIAAVEGSVAAVMMMQIS